MAIKGCRYGTCHMEQILLGKRIFYSWIQSMNLTAGYTLLGSFQMALQLLAFLRECPSQPQSSHALSLLQKLKQYCIVYCGISFRQSYRWMTLRQSIFTSQLHVLGWQSWHEEKSGNYSLNPQNFNGKQDEDGTLPSQKDSAISAIIMENRRKIQGRVAGISQDQFFREPEVVFFWDQKLLKRFVKSSNFGLR